MKAKPSRVKGQPLEQGSPEPRKHDSDLPTQLIQHIKLLRLAEVNIPSHLSHSPLAVQKIPQDLQAGIAEALTGCIDQPYATRPATDLKWSRCDAGAGLPLPPQTVSGEGRVQRLCFSRRQTAELLGISVESLDRLVRRGLLRPSRALRTPRFALEELKRFLNETR